MALHLLQRDFLVFLLRFLRIFSFRFFFFSLVRQAIFAAAFVMLAHRLRRVLLALFFAFACFRKAGFLFSAVFDGFAAFHHGCSFLLSGHGPFFMSGCGFFLHFHHLLFVERRLG